MLCKDELIKLWLKRSNEAVAVAKINLKEDYLSSAMNRIYYSIFYAVMALAEKANFKTSKHISLMGWFNKKLIHEDKVFAPEFFRIYKDTFTYRQDSDYDVTYEPEKETIEALLKDAEVFIKAVKKYII